MGALTIVFVLLLASIANTLYLQHLIAILDDEQYELPFGDRVIHYKGGYSIQSIEGRLMIERTVNGSRIPAGP